MKKCVAAAAAAAATAFAVAFGPLAGSSPAAAAPAGGSAATNVWTHGGSNLGECSAYLGQLDVPGLKNMRAEVNHVIQQHGSALGIASPGALYSVRAKQEVNRPPAEECLPRQLPGG